MWTVNKLIGRSRHLKKAGAMAGARAWASVPSVCMHLNAEQCELLPLAGHQPPEASLAHRRGTRHAAPRRWGCDLRHKTFVGTTTTTTSSTNSSSSSRSVALEDHRAGERWGHGTPCCCCSACKTCHLLRGCMAGHTSIQRCMWLLKSDPRALCT